MTKANAVAAEGEDKTEASARAGKADPVDVTIGRRVRRLRTARGMSQTELGAAINVTFQQIQKYEAGTNRIAASTLLRIAGALGVEPVDLLNEVTAPRGRVNDNARPPLLSTTGAESLLAAYAKLESESVRRAVLTLVRELGNR